MTTAQRTAVRLCIIEALNGSFFNLSGIHKACEVLGRPTYVMGNADWALLKALHVKQWADMDGTTKHEVIATVARVMGIEPSDATAFGTLALDPLCQIALPPCNVAALTA